MIYKCFVFAGRPILASFCSHRHDRGRTRHDSDFTDKGRIILQETTTSHRCELSMAVCLKSLSRVAKNAGAIHNFLSL